MTRNDSTDDSTEFDDALRDLVGAPPVDPGDVLARVSGTRIEPGVVLDDNFEIESELGRGGMGVVFLARHEALGRHVAIKLCRRQHSQRETARLGREARAIAALAHPNVVVVHHVGTIDGRVYVVMEYVAAGTLRTWLGDEPRAWPAVLDVFVQAARGLQAAHDRELVHRDFKPDNVLIGHDGRARVCDFGLAALVPHHDAGKTRAETTTEYSAVAGGTPRYMAPEQHAAGSVTPAADQFAWCVALWEALDGAHPFAGDDSIAIARSIVTGRRRPSRLPGVPRRIRRALDRGLAADPAQRHPSMEILLERLGPPGRRLGMWLGLASLLGVTALAAVPRQIDPCAAPHVAAPRWPQVARDALAEAFARSPLREGRALFARTEVAVDAHLQRWKQAEHETCVAVAGDTDRLESTHTCLEVDALRLTETLALLGEGQPDTLARTLELVHAVGDPQRCGTNSALEASNRVADVAPAARDALVQGQAALSVGEFEVAATRARTILDGAPTDRAVAQAELLLGEAAIDRQRLADAREHLELALRASIRASADDLSAVVACDLIYVETAGGRLQLAQRWYRRARAWSLAVGDPPELRIRAASYHGVTLRDDRQFAEAERVLRDALAEQRTLAMRSPAREAIVLDHLGSTLYSMKRYDEADEVLRQAEAMIVEELGIDHPHRITVLTSRQTLARRRGDLDESLVLGQRALDRVNAWLGADSPRAGMLHFNLGTVHMTAGDHDRAAAHYAEALELYARYPDPAAERMLAGNLSQLAAYRGDHHDSLRWRRAELALLESLDLPDKQVLSLSALSYTHSMLGDMEAATTAIEKAITLADDAYNAHDPQRAVAIMSLGRLQLVQERLTEGLATMERAHAVLNRSKAGRAHQVFAVVQFYRAVALVQLGRYAEALPIAERLPQLPQPPGTDAVGLYWVVAKARANTGNVAGATEALDSAYASVTPQTPANDVAPLDELRRQLARRR